MAFIPSVPTMARSSFCVSPAVTALRTVAAGTVTTMGLSPESVDRLKALVVAGVVAASVVTLAPSRAQALFHFSGERPADLGVMYGRYLNACPATPNCVSSSANVVSFFFKSFSLVIRVPFSC